MKLSNVMGQNEEFSMKWHRKIVEVHTAVRIAAVSFSTPMMME
jgi:hypothetical protein